MSRPSPEAIQHLPLNIYLSPDERTLMLDLYGKDRIPRKQVAESMGKSVRTVGRREQAALTKLQVPLSGELPPHLPAVVDAETDYVTSGYPADLLVNFVTHRQRGEAGELLSAQEASKIVISESGYTISARDIKEAYAIQRAKKERTRQEPTTLNGVLFSRNETHQ